jgi:plasmid stabilization system protein ParE
MGEARFQVVLTEDAWRDLEEVETYWTERGEAVRGENYYWDLRLAAERELSDPATARHGRAVRDCDVPHVQEILVFRGSYRIIYQRDESLHRVEVLRFWHSHPDAPPLD